MGPRPNISFSEYGHIAYQIKADKACSTMIANVLPTDSPLTQGVGSKGQTISFGESSHVAYQIKGKSTEHHERKYAVITHTIDPWVGSKGHFFSESGHVAFQIKVEEV